MTLTVEHEREQAPSKRVKAMQPVQLGLEGLLEDAPDVMRGARVGLICNQSSVDHAFAPRRRSIARSFGV